MISLMRAMAFTGGDWVIYILIACSVLTLAVIVERAIVIARERKEFEKVKIVFDLLLKIVVGHHAGNGDD